MARQTSLNRVQKLARLSPQLTAILEAILGDELRMPLEEAAQARRAPVGAISERLVNQFGQDAFNSTATRQFLGIAVAARLEMFGYIPDGTRVRLPDDPIFSTGALFTRVAAPPESSSGELLARFVAALTEEEARTVADLLEQRHALSTRSRGSAPNLERNEDAADEA